METYADAIQEAKTVFTRLVPAKDVKPGDVITETYPECHTVHTVRTFEPYDSVLILTRGPVYARRADDPVEIDDLDNLLID